MKPRSFGHKSKAELVGVHPHLVVLVTHALLICEIDFAVFDGLRTQEEQDALVAAGASRTRNSRHLTGHAVDLVPYVGGRVTWASDAAFRAIGKAMREASKVHDVNIIWGANVKKGGDYKSWHDAPHWELPRKEYP